MAMIWLSQIYPDKSILCITGESVIKNIRFRSSDGHIYSTSKYSLSKQVENRILTFYGDAGGFFFRGLEYTAYQNKKLKENSWAAGIAQT